MMSFNIWKKWIDRPTVINILNKIKSRCVRHRLQYPYPRFWILTAFTIFMIWFAFALPKPLFKPVYSTIIEDENGNFLSARIANDYQWRFPECDTVPAKFKQCVRLFEDEYFFYHPGVNPVSFGRAIIQNIKAKKVVSGGSTLTMQVIRLSLNDQSRNIFTKIHEMLLAFRLELGCSKNEILSLYASHAPFGGNVVGLDAAAWRYFGRPASRLSWGETAALAVLPNAPALIFPGKNHTIYLKKRNRLLDKLCAKGIIEKTTCELAKAEPLPDKPKALPQLAPHLLNKLINDGVSGQTIRTTINTDIQQFAANTARKYVRYYAGNFIQNMAIVVLDTRTGEAKAYVGNIDVEGLKNTPYVDNVIADRSSGSILKPFLYAAMLDEGQLLPTSLVSDIPTHFGAYAPENFEKTYEGVVPADMALAHSLNVPAVRELDQYGVVKLHHILHQAGFTSIDRTPDYYGLSLILGGAEVNLLEATSAYSGMGRTVLSYLSTGKYYADDFRPARLVKKEYPTDDKPVSPKIGAGALWYTLEALTTVNRPWGEIGWDFFASTHKVAWKTGTSIGSRDAWAIGVTPEYTVGVWVGNSSGEGRPGLTGVTHAAPVMFEIIKSLKTKNWFRQPTLDMQKISVCKQSGFRATDKCEAEEMWVPKNGVKVKSCPYHNSVFLDETGKYRVTGESYPVSKMQIQSRFVLPPAQEYYYKQNHPEYTPLPPYMPGCSLPGEQTMDILVPDNNTAVYIPKGIDGKLGMLVFEAVHRRKDATIFWHIDNDFIKETHGIHKIEVTPTIGKHILLIEDEEGNVVRRRFRVLNN
jgi:penicillin-binding protein 1C